MTVPKEMLAAARSHLERAGGGADGQRVLLHCDHDGCDAMVTVPDGAVRLPIEKMEGWYFDGEQAWFCPEHAPEMKMGRRG